MRLILYLLLAVILITLLRVVIGTVAQVLTRWLAAPPSGSTGGMQQAAELRKDPVCGTYVPTDSKFQRRFQGQVYYFCSQNCLQQFEQSMKTAQRTRAST